MPAVSIFQTIRDVKADDLDRSGKRRRQEVEIVIWSKRSDDGKLKTVQDTPVELTSNTDRPNSYEAADCDTIAGGAITMPPSLGQLNAFSASASTRKRRLEDPDDTNATARPDPPETTDSLLPPSLSNNISSQSEMKKRASSQAGFDEALITSSSPLALPVSNASSASQIDMDIDDLPPPLISDTPLWKPKSRPTAPRSKKRTSPRSRRTAAVAQSSPVKPYTSADVTATNHSDTTFTAVREADLDAFEREAALQRQLSPDLDLPPPLAPIVPQPAKAVEPHVATKPTATPKAALKATSIVYEIMSDGEDDDVVLPDLPGSDTSQSNAPKSTPIAHIATSARPMQGSIAGSTMKMTTSQLGAFPSQANVQPCLDLLSLAGNGSANKATHKRFTPALPSPAPPAASTSIVQLDSTGSNPAASNSIVGMVLRNAAATTTPSSSTSDTRTKPSSFTFAPVAPEVDAPLDDEETAECSICGSMIPIAELDQHERQELEDIGVKDEPVQAQSSTAPGTARPITSGGHSSSSNVVRSTEASTSKRVFKPLPLSPPKIRKLDNPFAADRAVTANQRQHQAKPADDLEAMLFPEQPKRSRKDKGKQRAIDNHETDYENIDDAWETVAACTASNILGRNQRTFNDSGTFSSGSNRITRSRRKSIDAYNHQNARNVIDVDDEGDEELDEPNEDDEDDEEPLLQRPGKHKRPLSPTRHAVDRSIVNGSPPPHSLYFSKLTRHEQDQYWKLVGLAAGDEDNEPKAKAAKTTKPATSRSYPAYPKKKFAAKGKKPFWMKGGRKAKR